MGALEPSAMVDGSTVCIFLGDSLIGTGHFSGPFIAGYQGQPLGETPQAHQAALDALAERLLAQGRAELAAMQADAYDEDGVDVSLIHWALGLTPLERLSALDECNHFIAEGRSALRSAGVFVPEDVE
jgi:hypothetical protein